MRIRTIAGCALLAGALALPAAPAAARKAKKPAAGPAYVLKTITFDTHYTEPPMSFDGFDCRFSLLIAGGWDEWCKGRFVGWADFTGTFTGRVYYDLLGWTERTGKSRYAGYNLLSGTIAGCGSGTWIMDEPDGVIDTDQPDLATQSVPGRNSWSYRLGSGTGDLKNLVSGSGRNEWRMYPAKGHDGSNEFGAGHFTGTITCRVPAPDRRPSRETRRR